MRTLRDTRYRCILLTALIALLLPLVASAQSTGRITGKVVDDTGAPIGGAEVTVRNNELQLERTTTTSARGDFLFALLPTGDYLVTITAAGKQPEVYNLSVGVGETQPLNVQLAAGGAVAETITVTGTASALETTAVGQNLNVAKQIEQLPVTVRTIERIAELAPNYSEGPTPNSPAFAGAPSFDTTVLLDGAEISDPYFGAAPVIYLEDALEEVQVLTSGVSARYGRFQGGILNATTKSGTNDFEGSVRLELTNQSWNSASPYGEALPDTLAQTYQGTLGGPIVRDRLWFFAGGRRITPTETTNVATYTQTSHIQTREEERWQLKLRGAITPSHMIDLSQLEFDSTVSDYVGLVLGEPAATGLRADPRSYTNLVYHGVLGANTFVEAQATRKKVSIASGGDPNGGDPFLENATSALFNNHWWNFDDPSVRNNETASLTATHVLDGGRFGSHTLEGGVQYVLSINGGGNHQSPTGYNLVATNLNRDFVAGVQNGAVTFNLYPNQAQRWVALPLEGQQEIANTALYVQDTIDIGRFRVDAGLRYEQYDGSGPTPDFNLDFSGLAPRLALTYEVTPAWQVQASYGRYIGRLNDRSANNATGVNAAPRNVGSYIGPAAQGLTAAQLQEILRNDANWQTIAWVGDTTQPTVFVSSDIEAPYSDDINLSVRHALPRSSGFVTLSYIDRTYRQLLDDFIGEVCERGFDYGQPCASTRTIVVPNSSLRPTVDVRVWDNNPDVKRDYRALTAVWDYRPSPRWQLAGNYTLGETKANYEGEGRNTPASGSFSGDYPKSMDVAAAVPYGYADDDIRHRLNLIGAYNFDFQRLGNLTLGSVFRYQSGYPYSYAASVPLAASADYASESGTYTYYFGSDRQAGNHTRGSERFNDWWKIDLAGTYEVPLFYGVSPFVKLAVTNVLDNDELIAFQTGGTAVRDASGNITGWAPAGTCGLDSEPSKNCSSWGRVRDQLDYQEPRRYQLSVGLRF